MTISKGSDWGVRRPLPPGAPVAASNAELRRIVEAARRRDDARVGPVGLTGGSLWETVGGAGAVGRLHTDDAVHYAVDVVRVDTDGSTHWFVASLVARTRTWTSALVAMNAQFLGEGPRRRRLGVRAHPGDGLVDVYEARLGMSDVVRVASRARHGTHLPHPGITERRVADVHVDLRPRRLLWLDGEPVGRASDIALRVEPDALIVVV